MTSLEFVAVLPIVILVVTGIICMLMGAGRRETATAWCGTIALIGLAAAAGAITTQQRGSGLAYSGSLSVDPFAEYFQLLFLVIVALVGLASREYLW